MGWGSVGNHDVKRAARGWQNARSQARDLRSPADIVFVTSDERSRSYCHTLCENIQLMFKQLRIAHDENDDILRELVARARLVVIVTCRASLDKDSSVQKREKLVADVAIGQGVRIAILAGECHEAVQPHLAAAIGTRPLVIVPVFNGFLGGGFTDCFPIRTQFVERGETPGHIEQIASELINRAS